jgi:ubiquinone/menaquinone biosynthesis C-methylase UbiE
MRLQRYLAGLLARTLVNGAMLNAARKNTDIEWHLGSATGLPFDDASFDVVFCQQGLQYFPDRAKGMSEMRRVLGLAGGFPSTFGGRSNASCSTRYSRKAFARSSVPRLWCPPYWARR